MSIQVELTKDYAGSKKGDKLTLGSILATKLVYKYKVAKLASEDKPKAKSKKK